MKWFFARDLDGRVSRIEGGILNGVISAILENNSDKSWRDIRVFERYSFWGENRVSLNVTLYQENRLIYLFAITRAAVRRILFKVNIFSEEAFLNKLKEIL